MKTKKYLKRIRETQFLIMILVILTLVLALIPHVSAQTITMANPDATEERDILVYFVNGTIYGSYNTSSIITLDSAESYIFTLKPQYSNPLEDPGGFLNSMLSFVVTNAIALILLVFLAALWLGRK